ncbi:MAG: hypothetical protein AB7E45_00095 [Candidatus Caldatribacteriota bacterium]
MAYIKINKADDGSYIMYMTIEERDKFLDLKYTAKGENELFTKLKEVLPKLKSSMEQDEYLKTFSNITSIHKED